MSAALVAGLLAGFGAAVPVGAVGAHLVSLTARTSLHTGACAALGMATADGLYALVATAGGTGLAPLLDPVARPLRIVSALVLPALAARTAVTAPRSRPGSDAGPRAAPPTPARAFLTLLGITLLNPLTVLYFAALVLGGGSQDGIPARAAFTAGAFAALAVRPLLD
nr:LysE family transporter [Kitasatospora sp. K002]